MLKIAGINLFLILISSCWASEFKLTWNEIYVPSDEVRDLAVDVRSEKIQKLVNEKLVNTKVEDLYLSFYWLKNNKDIILNSSSELPINIKKIVIDELESKLDIIVGGKLENFVKGYDYLGEQKGWHRWSDPTKLKRVKRIRIKKEKLTTLVVEEYILGLIKTKYIYKKENWSKTKIVLTNIEKEISLPNYKVKTHTKIKYIEKNKIRLPGTLEVVTIQDLNSSSTPRVVRTFSVIYSFQNYRINQAEALRWFTTR